MTVSSQTAGSGATSADYKFSLDTTTANSLSKSANQQAASLEETAAAVEEIASNIKNSSSGQNDNETGKGWVSKNKYFASFGENTIISNGVKTWVVIKEEGSIYESDADNGDDALSPARIMSIWEKGFKNYYSKETNLNGKMVDEIKLIPSTPSTSDYHTILLYISKDSELKRAIMKGNDGTIMTYSLNKMLANPQIDESKFKLDTKKYPGYPVIRD